MGYGFPRRKKFSASRQYCECILIESKLCHTILQYYHTILKYCTILCEKYCDIPYCRIRQDAPPIMATPKLVPKRRQRIPTIVPSYWPVLRRHQLIVKSSGPNVAAVMPPVALLPLVVIMPPVEVVEHSVTLLPLATKDYVSTPLT